MVYQRTNNNAGFGSNEIELLTQNAFLLIENGPIYASQKNTNATAAPWPTLVSDLNLFVSIDEIGQTTTSGTLVDSWAVNQFSDWQTDTGRDATSLIRTRSTNETRTAEPTVAELEIIRLYDDYDTFDAPTLAMIGDWPFQTF